MKTVTRAVVAHEPNKIGTQPSSGRQFMRSWLSVGTESVEDLIWDLKQGFAHVAATVAREVATA